MTERLHVRRPIRTLAWSLAAAFLLISLLAGMAGCGTGGDDGSAMATIGSVNITQSVYNKRLAEFEAEYAGQFPDQYSDPDGYKEFQQSVLEYLVRVEIVGQKSTALGISVSDTDVDTQIEQVKTQNYGGDQAAFDQALKDQGLTLAIVKVRIKEQLLMRAAFSAVTKDMTTVPEADLQAYYDANKADYNADETRQARHILISPSSLADDASTTVTDPSTTTTTQAPTEADWAAAKAKADEVRADIVGGQDFAEAAKQYSDDPGSKEAGGELGTFGKGEMVAAFDEAVFSLSKDEISQPIKTEYGYHIIQVEAINVAHQQTLDEVKDAITSSLLEENKVKAWDNWMTQAKLELKVTYKEGMEATTTTTAAPTDASTTPTTAGDGSATTGSTSSPATTESVTTTTAPPQSTTTTVATTTST